MNSILNKFAIFLLTFSIVFLVLVNSGEVIINNFPYLLIVYYGSYKLGDKLGDFLFWNFKDTSIPQPNNF